MGIDVIPMTFITTISSAILGFLLHISTPHLHHLYLMTLHVLDASHTLL